VFRLFQHYSQKIEKGIRLKKCNALEESK